MPAGRVALIAGSSAITASAVSSGFAAGVGKTPMKVPGWPLKVTMASWSSEASSIVATSRRRTTASPSALSGSAPKASGVCRVDLHGDGVGDELVLGLAWCREEVRGADRSHAPPRLSPRAPPAAAGRSIPAWRSSPPPMISISATPGMVDMRGRTTRSRYSVSCSWVMFGFSAARYISAKSNPVPLTMMGSSASAGRRPRTCWTLDRTSVSATSGSAPSRMFTLTTLAEGRLVELT